MSDATDDGVARPTSRILVPRECERKTFSHFRCRGHPTATCGDMWRRPLDTAGLTSVMASFLTVDVKHSFENSSGWLGE